MCESLIAPGSEQRSWPLSPDFNEMVGKILQFVLTDGEMFDWRVFEGTVSRHKLAHRPKASRRLKPAFVRAGSTGQPCGLTQREVAIILRVSERAVRNIERRAIKKLLAHAELRQAWQDYLSGQLDEGELSLTPEEVYALLGLVRTPEEAFVIRKVLWSIQA